MSYIYNYVKRKPYEQGLITKKCHRLHTVVWEKLAVGNIHEKKFCGKKFSS